MCKKPFCNACFESYHVHYKSHKCSDFNEKKTFKAASMKPYPIVPPVSKPYPIVPSVSQPITLIPVSPSKNYQQYSYIRMEQTVANSGHFEKRTLHRYCDVLFLIDATGSMSLSIKAAHDKAQKIALNFRNEYNNINFRFGSICYRDPIDSSSDKHELQKLDTDINQLVAFLDKIQATGGGDGPEDYAGAFELALDKINWKENCPRNIILISDAPAHGKYFCGFNNHEEQTERLVNILKRIANSGIFISAIPINGNENLISCFNKMKEIYDKNIGKIKSKFTIEPFGTVEHKKIPIEKQIGKAIKTVSKKLVSASIAIYYATVEVSSQKDESIPHYKDKFKQQSIKQFEKSSTYSHSNPIICFKCKNTGHKAKKSPM